MKSKTIILSNENNKGRGILTLFQDDDLLQCRLRLYNIEKLDRLAKIGVYHEQKAYSANLLEKNGAYTSSIVGNFDIDKDFYTAIINTANNNEVVLSGGTYAGFFFNDQSVFDDELNMNNNNFTPAKINNHLEIFEDDNIKTIFQNKADFNNKTKAETNLEQNDCLSQCDKCENCIYKEYFYSQQKLDNENNQLETENKKNMVEEKTTESENTQKSVIQSIIPQFKYVFENYPANEVLNNLLPNSKFVTINENQEEYSIGAIYEQEEMKYICYAVLKDYNSPAPQELGKHYQWLPLDKEDPLSEGYYIVFQDAHDLKIVEM